jgi:hypothetical protein
MKSESEVAEAGTKCRWGFPDPEGDCSNAKSGSSNSD